MHANEGDYSEVMKASFHLGAFKLWMSVDVLTGLYVMALFSATLYPHMHAG